MTAPGRLHPLAVLWDLLVLVAIGVVVTLSWRGAAPRPSDAPRAARQYVAVLRALPAGSRVRDEDVEESFGRVVGGDSLARGRAAVVGRFTTRALSVGAPVYTGDVRPTAPAPTAERVVLFPVIVRRGTLLGVTTGSSVIFVRDSSAVIDARCGRPPYRGFTVQAVVPTPEDTTTATILVLAPTARLRAMRALTRPGWHPAVVAAAP